ncbi:MAG: hypothetical protein HFG30_05650 [Eubacterium sp.]|nr:hypothetical protein [Eubacterium sp.]MCI9565477.1 hypothetical protein [Eubacterium sp.]
MKRKLKCLILMLLILGSCNLYCMNVNAKNVNTVALIVNHKTRIKVPESKGKIIACNSTNQKVVKITQKKNIINLKAAKTGKCVLNAKTSKGSIMKYYVYVTKDSAVKTYKGSKIKIRIKNVKKNNHNIVLRVKLSNGKKEFAAYECGYKLQQKKKRKWKTKKSVTDISGNSYTISGKSRIEFPILLSNHYKNLKKGTYRIQFLINGKMRYVKFKIK